MNKKYFLLITILLSVCQRSRTAEFLGTTLGTTAAMVGSDFAIRQTMAFWYPGYMTADNLSGISKRIVGLSPRLLNVGWAIQKNVVPGVLLGSMIYAAANVNKTTFITARSVGLPILGVTIFATGKSLYEFYVLNKAENRSSSAPSSPRRKSAPGLQDAEQREREKLSSIISHNRWMMVCGLVAIGLHTYSSSSLPVTITDEVMRNYMVQRGLDAAVKHGPGIIAKTLGWPF